MAIESLKRTIEEMRADLAGEHPTRLEKILVDQVVSTWMEVKYVEGISASPATRSLEQARFHLKRLESAQKRFENAVKTLTTTRTMMPSGLAPAQSVKLHAEEKRAHA